MNNKIFLIIRYISIAIAFFLVSISTQTLNIYMIILLLLYIINNQIRYFNFSEKQCYVLISLIGEFIMIYLINRSIQSSISPLFIIPIMDSLLYLNKINSLFLIIFGSIIYALTAKNLGYLDIISNIVFFLIISLLTYLIKEVQSKNHNVDDVYRKFRQSEDVLIKKNNELEIYSNSIKELSILKERNRISREIHDSVGHSLSTIIIQLGAIEKISAIDPKEAGNMALNLRDFSKNGLEEIRKALKELKPREFKEYEIFIALEELIKDFSKLTGIDVRLGFSKHKWQVDEENSLVIYRTIQEFLSNSTKHGKPTKINIFMNFNHDDLIITLQDNGVGINNIIPGMGLTNISERIKELGGKVKYESKEGKGFLLRVTLNGGNYEEN